MSPLFLALALLAQTLDLPPRPADAPGGAAFARSIAALPLGPREEAVHAQIKAGNVPESLRRLVPVTVARDGATLVYRVAPDYLAVGSDADPFLVPLSPATAQAIADDLGCLLPTPKMVDDIYAQATVKLVPEPIPPSPAMTTVPVFLDHNAKLLAQRGGRGAGGLTAGHKKDVVIAPAVLKRPGKVAIYGWHREDGRPIQPLYAGHVDTWVDYSHGVRLVARKAVLNGVETTVEKVLADPATAPLLNAEGVLSQTRYLAKPSSAPGETFEWFDLDPGVRIALQRPEPMPDAPVLLVVYGLPNGNTIEQTLGKTPLPGDDWHFDIQHTAAQTRFLRRTIKDRTVVVAYLENDLRSWPAWRRKHGDARIPEILGEIRRRVGGRDVRLALTGHSGGGSLIFGYLNENATIPDDVERIAFLDANYAYETGKHRDRLVAWLKSSDRHYLVVLAYNDAVALLNGKTFVSESGGTWGRSRAMLDDLEASFPLTRSPDADLRRVAALDGRVTFLLKENPEKAIYHTVQVERNGLLEALLAGTPLQGRDYTYFGPRAYGEFIRP